MKAFRVKIEVDLVILAEDEDAAFEDAEIICEHTIEDGSIEAEVVEAVEINKHNLTFLGRRVPHERSENLRELVTSGTVECDD